MYVPVDDDAFVESPCTAYVDGLWQRGFPSGVFEVIGVHGSTLAMAFPSDVTAPVPEDQLHALITSLEPVEPSVLAGLKAGH
jgi:hypothetical protein